ERGERRAPPPGPRSEGISGMAEAQSRITDESGRKPEPKPPPPPPITPDEIYDASPRLRDLDAQIENELAEALGGLSDRELYGAPEEKRQRTATAPAEGKKAKVVAIRGNDIFFDIPGGRSQGALTLQDFPEGAPAIGSEVPVTIEGYDPQNGLILLSRKGAAVHADWSSVVEGMIVEARMTESNKGGLAVDVNGIRGFMPISQIDL